MRRWTRSAWPLSRRTTMYLPRRSTATTRSPSSIAATTFGSSGRVSRTSSMRADAIRFPSIAAASRPRSVSTSGSSGTQRLQHDRDRARSLVAELVGVADGGCRLVGRCLVARVDLGERLAFLDLVAALPAAHDPDGVIDVLVLH